jgi:hypothetical protein
MSRAWPAAASVATAVVVVLVGVAQGWWRGGTRVPPPSQPLVATPSLSARTLAFGDPLSARLDLLIDPRAADPASVRVKPRFTPYRIVGTTLTTRRAGGALLSYRYALECLSPACVPGKAQSEQLFLATVVSYRTRSGAVEKRTVDWPDYTIVSRLNDADRRNPTDRLRANAALPAVSYRFDPGTLQVLLPALSGALAMLAAALAALAFRRRAQPIALAGPELAPLDRALLLVRASTANGFPAERRKALGRLARELRASGRLELADTAVRLAWSAESPSADAAGSFATEVETSIGAET